MGNTARQLSDPAGTACRTPRAFLRTKFAWTLALKAVFALAILCAAYGVVRLYLQKRWVPGSVLAGVLIGWVYLMRYPWWFA